VVEKTVSAKQLKLLAKEGADIKFAPESMEIAQFGDLLDTLKTMAANEQERIRADLARNQTTLEILATLQALIKKPPAGVTMPALDLTPLKDILEEIRAERDFRSRIAYEFDIQRDGRGFSQKITATPVQPTLN
jgi:hypothetical protein